LTKPPPFLAGIFLIEPNGSATQHHISIVVNAFPVYIPPEKKDLAWKFPLGTL
jgi:hypothetical protein